MKTNGKSSWERNSVFLFKKNTQVECILSIGDTFLCFKRFMINYVVSDFSLYWQVYQLIWEDGLSDGRHENDSVIEIFSLRYFPVNKKKN